MDLSKYEQSNKQNYDNFINYYNCVKNIMLVYNRILCISDPTISRSWLKFNNKSKKFGSEKISVFSVIVY
jgi:uncharacterized ubiquitin-like protein YukD